MTAGAFRFPSVSCSQCGNDFGPGDSGFSICSEHRGRALDLDRKAEQAIQRGRELARAAGVQMPRGDVDELSDTALVDIWDAMPGQPDGFLKYFGYLQFARAVIKADRAIAERRRDASSVMLTALLDCESLMTKDLAGLKLLQPELRQVQAAIAQATGEAS